MTTSIVLLSGGIDSTVLLYDLIERGHTVAALSFDYGQTHRRELRAAAGIAAGLGVGHYVTTIPPVVLSGSSLTGDPDGNVVVPNRNLVFIALAGALAVQLDADYVAIACHAGDAPLFPDCRSTFLDAAGAALMAATEKRVRLLRPFSPWSKLDIVRHGRDLGVPFEETWSCYAGGDEPCRECLACRERREALLLAGAPS